MKILDVLNIIQKTHCISATDLKTSIEDLFNEKSNNNISKDFITLNKVMRSCFSLSFIARFTGKAVTVTGDESAFHNLFVSLAKEDLYRLALYVADKGLKVYPLSSDLLTDYIVSSVQSNKLICSIKRKKCINALMRIPRNLWTSQAYTSYINYLISELMRVKLSKFIQKQIEESIITFRENIPFNENSYYIESCFYDALNKPQESRDILEKALVESEIFPTKCASKLTKMYLDIAEYNKAIYILLQSKRNIACFKDTEDIGNICFYLMLSRLGKYFFCKDELSKYELEKLYTDSLEDFRIINKMNFYTNEAHSLYARLDNLSTIFSAETGYIL